MTTKIYTPASKDEHLFFAKWLGVRIPDFNPNNVNCVVCYRNDKIACVFGYSNPHYNRVECAFAAADPRWATRANILTMLSPAFQNPNSGGVTAMIYRSNKKSRKFVEFAGFKHEGTMRSVTKDGRSMLIYGLTRKEYEELIVRFKGKETLDVFRQTFGLLANG